MAEPSDIQDIVEGTYPVPRINTNYGIIRTILTGLYITLLESADRTLSNLIDVPLARTNLGLGNSAIRSVGLATGTVAAGDHLHDDRYLQLAGGNIVGDLNVGGNVTINQVQISDGGANAVISSPSANLYFIGGTQSNPKDMHFGKSGLLEGMVINADDLSVYYGSYWPFYHSVKGLVTIDNRRFQNQVRNRTPLVVVGESGQIAPLARLYQVADSGDPLIAGALDFVVDDHNDSTFASHGVIKGALGGAEVDFLKIAIDGLRVNSTNYGIFDFQGNILMRQFPFSAWSDSAACLYRIEGDQANMMVGTQSGHYNRLCYLTKSFQVSDRALSDIEPPSPSAIGSLDSTTRGFQTPRMTSTQRDAIASPDRGIEIYNLDTDEKNFYNGTEWRAVVSVAA